MTNTFNDNIEILGNLGTGGMSVVYKARHIPLNKIVAVKMMHAHLLNDQSIRRFQQEAKTASSLRHQNVVAVHDFGLTESGQPYMIMDLIEGLTLADYIAKNGALPLPLAVEIFIQVCEALEQAHAQGILHRDLKPSNIMLSEKKDGYVVHLFDFGLAKILDGGPGGIAQNLTQTGELMGTPLYMSPEHCMGRELDQRSDIYSLGCIVYESLVGWPPHQGDTIIDTIFKHLSDEHVPINMARTDITFPPAVIRLVDNLLAKKPEDRYQSIADVKQELANIQGGGLAAQLKSATWISSVNFSRKTTTVILAVALCLFLFVTGVVSLIVASGRLQQSQANDNEHLEKLEALLAERANRSPSPYYALAKNGELDLTGANMTPDDWNRELTWAAKDRDVKSVQLAGSDVHDIRAMTSSGPEHITSLLVNGADLPSESLTTVGNMKGLETLDLSHERVNLECLKAIATLPNLKTLSLNDTYVKDEDLRVLSACRSLETLLLEGTHISDRGLQSIASLPLKKLYVSNTLISPDAVTLIASNWKDLEHLTLSRTPLSEGSFRSFSRLQRLQLLQMSHVQTLKDIDLQYLDGLLHLETLNILDCPLTDSCARYIVKMPLSALTMTKLALPTHS